MPGATPVFGIPYPEMSDPFNSAVFAATANAIDLVLAGTDALLEARLRPPALSLNFSSAGPLAPGATVLTSWTTERYDTHAMFNPIFPTLVFCQKPGIYAYNVANGRIAGYTSRTFTQFGLLVNAVAWQFDRRFPSDASDDLVTFSGLVPLNLNDQVTVNYTFGGVGNATSIDVDLTLEMVAPL